MRPIDADALVEAIKDYPYGFRGMIVCDIAKQPTVDAVPVVRCRECLSYRPDKAGNYCRLFGRVRMDDFFCAYGERREDD